MPPIEIGQYLLVYNAFSFTFATMAAATTFLWFGRSQVGPAYKTALTISGSGNRHRRLPLPADLRELGNRL